MVADGTISQHSYYPLKKGKEMNEGKALHRRVNIFLMQSRRIKLTI